MQISIMQDAANKIKKAFKIFSAMKKRNLWLSLGINSGEMEEFADSMGGIRCSNRTYGSAETYGSMTKSTKSSNGPYNNVNGSYNVNINSNNNGSSSSRSRGKSVSSSSPMSLKSNTNTNTSTVGSRKDRSLPSSSKQPNTNSKGTEYANSNVPAAPNKYFTTKNLKGMASKFLYGPKGKSSSTNDVTVQSYSDAPSLYPSTASSSSSISRVNSRGLSVKTNISLNSTYNSSSSRSDNLNNSSSTISDDTSFSPKGTKTSRQRAAITSPKNVRNTSTDSNVTTKSPRSAARSGSSSSPVPSVSPTAKGITRESKNKNSGSSSSSKNFQNSSVKVGSEKSVVSTGSTSTSASSSASVASGKGVRSSKSNASTSGNGAGTGSGSGAKSSGQKGETGSGILSNDCSKGSNRSNNNSTKNNQKSNNNNNNNNNAANNASIGAIVNAVHKNKQDVNIELKEKQKQNQRNLLRLRKEHSLRIKEDSFYLVTQKAFCLISVEADHSALFQVLYNS